ncbi:MAG: uL15 family ribosomal protein [Candidatus Micrarchaeaceae archaeon]
MVVRKNKRIRKFFGSRHMGLGNVKNGRGKGDRGGVGRANLRKNKFTWVTAKAPELIRTKGFHRWGATKHNTISLREINKMNKEEVELPGYKVLGNGMLTGRVRIKASAFTKYAKEKIEKSGGEAIKIEASRA